MAHFLAIFGSGWRMVAAALLFIVSAHAAAPLGQPLERLAGSAFNASTAEVSLIGKRGRLGRQAPTEVRAPPGLATARPIAALETLVIALAPLAPRTHFAATGPLLRRTPFAPLGPRAPPAA